MTYYWIHGLSGKMGQSISCPTQLQVKQNSRRSSLKEKLSDPKVLDNVELIFDFSGQEGNKELLSF